MGNAKPIVSVLVSVYNVDKYLRHCLDSLIGQTLKEIEIVCVNDGSTDSSSQILQEYAELDSRIVIVDKLNGGLPSARNAGLDVAQGNYVGFVDGDDYVDENMFRRMLSVARKNNADIVVCGGHIVPNDKNATLWLKDALSPRNIVYKSGGTEALFIERGAKPFIWRDFIRKEIIDKNHFRFDEDIIVGEDQAFQFKVFPAARNVTFISDKLYYYRYSRPESIMNEPQYKDYGVRIEKHVNMIESISNSWKGISVDHNSQVRFFEWCVDFIYWDIIRVSAVDRIRVAKKFCNLLIHNGYYNYYKDYSADIRKHFEYIYELSSQTVKEPVVSVVAIMSQDNGVIDDFLNSLLRQSESRIEILLYENASDDTTKNIVRERLYKDPRICVRLGEWQPISEKYNDAILTAKGKYICFLSTSDYIKDSHWLDQALDEFKDEAVDVVGYREGLSGKQDIKMCQNASFRQFLYRLSKIRNNNLKFADYSLMTGSVFFTKYCLVSQACCFIPKFMFHSEVLRKSCVPAEEIKLVLRSFVWLLQAAKEHDLPILAERVTELLNSENYVRLITGSTYGLNINKLSADNPVYDFNTEVLTLLVKANELAALRANDKAILRALSEFIAKRHLFLEKF